MRHLHKLIGIALFAVMIAGTARAAETPDTTIDTTVPQASSPASPSDTTAADMSKHSCIDMNGKPFDWRWANVPFASTCDAAPDRK